MTRPKGASCCSPRRLRKSVVPQGERPVLGLARAPEGGGFCIEASAGLCRHRCYNARPDPISLLSGSHAPAWEQVQTLQRREGWWAGAAGAAARRSQAGAQRAPGPGTAGFQPAPALAQGMRWPGGGELAGAAARVWPPLRGGGPAGSRRSQGGLMASPWFPPGYQAPAW